jgi:hypothetical protein
MVVRTQDEDIYTCFECKLTIYLVVYISIHFYGCGTSLGLQLVFYYPTTS